MQLLSSAVAGIGGAPGNGLQKAFLGGCCSGACRGTGGRGVCHAGPGVDTAEATTTPVSGTDTGGPIGGGMFIGIGTCIGIPIGGGPPWLGGIRPGGGMNCPGGGMAIPGMVIPPCIGGIIVPCGGGIGLGLFMNAAAIGIALGGGWGFVGMGGGDWRPTTGSIFVVSTGIGNAGGGDVMPPPRPGGGAMVGFSWTS